MFLVCQSDKIIFNKHLAVMCFFSSRRVIQNQANWKFPFQLYSLPWVDAPLPSLYQAITKYASSVSYHIQLGVLGPRWTHLYQAFTKPLPNMHPQSVITFNLCTQSHLACVHSYHLACVHSYHLACVHSYHLACVHSYHLACVHSYHLACVHSYLSLRLG